MPLRIRFLAASFTCLLPLVLAACGENAPEKGGPGGAGAAGPQKSAASGPGGADTPAGVVKRMSAAAKSQNWHEFAACIAPDDRMIAAGGMYMAAKMIPQFGAMFVEMIPDEAEKTAAKAKMDGMVKAVEEVAKKHGMDGMDDEVLGKLMMGGAEGGSQGEAMESVRAAMKEAAPNLDAAAFMADVMEAMSKMEGMQGFKSPADAIQGDLEDVVIEGDKARGKLSGGDQDDMHFVRVDGRWYLSATGMLGN